MFVIFLCILATSFVASSLVEEFSLSLIDESAFRFFFVFFFLGLIVLLGEDSGEVCGCLGFGLPFGGVVRGISISCVDS